ncbi:MAG: hypothetical protein P4L85_11040 [Paludisphaera borealis]|uniref:hypothetical protein n=1 Tax=Paludisphaera borealis TaxID=1387353 RepID=UPI002841E099|nr:hypothetical protein [Paludisphaera borealis]MDR3619874.1 hypothetical protein [Paludisphaera borealis]
MTRTLRGSLLIASMLIVAWATTSEACHRRRARPTTTYCNSGATYGGTAYTGATGQYDASGNYATTGGGYYGGGTAGYPAGYGGGTAGYPGGYDFGRPGYNPGGLGGPASGLGVRPGLGVGGFGPGR